MHCMGIYFIGFFYVEMECMLGIYLYVYVSLRIIPRAIPVLFLGFCYDFFLFFPSFR